MKKLKVLPVLYISLFIVNNIDLKAQNADVKTQTSAFVKQETDKVFDKLVKIRRQIHQNPELAGKEKQTQEIIKQYLLDLGLEVKTDIYGYGLVGILKGAKKGKNIAWRADMDALPNDFEDKVDFSSKNKGVQHGCGHDVHMAIALGIAEVLSKNKKELKGNAYFIFQPEEETFKGGKGMANHPYFSKIKLSEMYSCHITPFPLGQIIVKPNEMYAYQKGVKIQLNKEVSEEKVKNLMAKMASSLTRMVNNSKPWEIQNALHPQDGLASPSTIFRDYFLMDPNFVKFVKNDTLNIIADVYETEKSKLNDIIPSIKKVIEAEGLAKQLISVSFIKENPTVQNDPKLTETAIAFLDKEYGKGTVTQNYGQIPFSNDDFSYFQQKVPGVYFFLGGSNFEKGMIAMIHAPNFMVDEESIRTGVERFSSLLFERLRVK